MTHGGAGVWGSPALRADTKERETVSRQIDYSKPDDWTEDDRAYLAERPETVPAEYRHLIMPTQPPMAPMAEGQDPRMVRLTDYVRRNYPDRAGEDPITVVLDLLGGTSEAETVDDDYDQWKVSELSAEAAKRDPEVTLPDGADARKKQPWVDALRTWDRENPS